MIEIILTVMRSCGPHKVETAEIRSNSAVGQWLAYDPATMSQSRVRAAVRTSLRLVRDVLRLLSSAVRSHTHLAAENLFLRKQLALYVERQVKPRRADDATRIALRRRSFRDCITNIGSSDSGLNCRESLCGRRQR